MQGNFTGMYSGAGQQGFGGGQTFTGNLQPGYNAGQNFSSVNQSGGFYPQWFAAYTGRQPMQVDQMINMVFGSYLNNLYQNGIGQQTLGNIQATGEVQTLMNKVRTFAFVIMVDKTGAGSQQQTDFIIQRCVEVVLLGEMVKRAGGPQMPIVQSIGQMLNVDIADRFATYVGFENNPNVYALAIQNAENNIRQAMAQQQQTAWQNQGGQFGNVGGFGTNQHVHPAAMAAVPSGNFAAHLNQNQQQQMNAGGQFAVAGNAAQANATINQIGNVASSAKSVYAIALEQQRAAEQEQFQYVQERQAESIQTNVATQPADNVPGVCSAFQLAAQLRKSGMSMEIPAEPVVLQEPQPEPVVEPVAPVAPVVEEQPKVKAVIPNGWNQKVSDAMELSDPEPASTVVPPEGLPSIGFYNFAAGNPTTMDDFKTPATAQQHADFGTKATHTFEEDGHLDEDDFINAVEQQLEAEIQSEHEASRAVNPLNTTSTMDELVAQGQAQGLSTKLEDQELRIDFGDIDPKSRRNICRKFHISAVPAYLKGRDRVIQVVKGNSRTLVVERSEDVKYEEHETEQLSGTPVFATWDAAARNIGSARTLMKDAAEKPIWSSDALLEKLDEKLNGVTDQTEAEAKLSEVLAERSIIQIDGALTCNSANGDYQGEVLTELVNRGVGENVGALLDNSVVEYTRFETACLAVNGENQTLLEAINDAQSAPELIGKLNAFRKESTLPVREIARLHHRFTKYLNQLLKIEFTNGWETSDPIEDFDDLIRELLIDYKDQFNSVEVLNKLTAVYTTAARKAYSLATVGEDETLTVGNKHSVVLLPIYYSQYPIATLDDVGVIKSEDHPELYELLNKVQGDGNDVKIVTLDNYALTFVRSLGDEGLFYLVEVAN